jgi:hypothetical protein
MKGERIRFRVTPYVCPRGHVKLVVSPDTPSVNCIVGDCLSSSSIGEIVQAGPSQQVDIVIDAGHDVVLSITTKRRSHERQNL